MKMKLPKRLGEPTKLLLVGYISLSFFLLLLVLFLEIVKFNQYSNSLLTDPKVNSQLLKDFHQANIDYLKIASLSAERKKQGIDVATVEAELLETKQVILDGNFASASATLHLLGGALDSLLNGKLQKDRLASEAASKRAEEEAVRKKAEAASVAQTTAPTSSTSDPNSLGFGYSKTTINTKNGSFTISLIKVNLASSRVIMDSANDNDCANACPTMPLADYVSRHGATAGINGTYFCPPDYASCAGKVASFDFPIFNTRLGRWINQGNLYWTNRAMMTFPGGGAAFYPASNAAPTGGFSAAIVSSPGLVHNGNDIVGQYQLTSAQTTKGARGGLGVKGSTLFMVVASGASVPDLAAIFQALGVDHAMNIDGGGSSALWAGGYRVGPGRSLPNALVIQ